MLLWNINKPFASLTRSELLSFIKHTPQIVTFLKANFVQTNTLNDLCELLEIWTKISPFLVITDISDVSEYKSKLTTFERNLKDFYKIGRRSFLTLKEDGDDETFYMHVLRFYLPRIAKETLDRHGLGLGIFTMQGFERRNKESKNVFKRFNNCKGKKLVQNLRQLWDVFKFGSNAY